MIMQDHAYILARFMHERYEFNACSMHDKMQDSCIILAKIHCMIMHDLIPWVYMYLIALTSHVLLPQNTNQGVTEVYYS